MPLTYLIDEHLRGDFQTAIINAALARGYSISVLQVGDQEGPPLGTKDRALLRWCESHEFVLVSRDKKTLPNHLATHLAAGGHCPGIFIIVPASWQEVLETLVLMAAASLPGEYRDQVIYIP